MEPPLQHRARRFLTSDPGFIRMILTTSSGSGLTRISHTVAKAVIRKHGALRVGFPVGKCCRSFVIDRRGFVFIPANLGCSAGDRRRGQSLVVRAIRKGGQCARAINDFRLSFTSCRADWLKQERDQRGRLFAVL
jgi:hypothetical protein